MLGAGLGGSSSVSGGSGWTADGLRDSTLEIPGATATTAAGAGVWPPLHSPPPAALLEFPMVLLQRHPAALVARGNLAEDLCRCTCRTSASGAGVRR